MGAGDQTVKARTRKLIHLLKGGYPVVADLPWLKGNVFGYNEERKVFRVREGAVTLEIPFEAPERTDVVLAPIEGTWTLCLPAHLRVRNALREGTLKRIHVNQHHIRANMKDGLDRPIFTVKVGKLNFYGRQVRILGPSELIYRPCNPLSCGAMAWVETRAEVEVIP